MAFSHLDGLHEAAHLLGKGVLAESIRPLAPHKQVYEEILSVLPVLPGVRQLPNTPQLADILGQGFPVFPPTGQ